MNLAMLSAVGPGVMQGQQAQQELIQSQQLNAARAKAVADAARAQQASAWMKGGGLADGLSALGQPVPGGASPAAMPSPMAAPSGGGSAPVSAPQPSQTTAISPEIDKLARLMIGEAGGEDDRGQQAVAAVVRNRANQAGMSMDDVMSAPSQFEPYNDKKRWSELQAIGQDSPAYLRAVANARRIIEEGAPDPTDGADHFYSPSAQQLLGRAKPAWDNGSGVDLGAHRFFKLGYKGGGNVATGSTTAPAGQDAAASTTSATPAAVGHPDEPDYGHEYGPIDNVRMTLQLADFIQSRYKQVTGQDLDPDLLMDQVERVAKLSNQFTGAQRVAVQQGVAALRAQTSMRNTDVRTGTQKEIATDRNETSRANTTDRTKQSDTNSRRAADTSRANTGDRVAQSDKNNERSTSTSSANTDKRTKSSERNTDVRTTSSSRNTDVMAKAKTDAAKISMGKDPAEVPAPKPSPKPAAAAPGGTGPKLPDPKGVAEGTVLRARGATPNSLGAPQYILKSGKWVKIGK